MLRAVVSILILLAFLCVATLLPESLWWQAEMTGASGVVQERNAGQGIVLRSFVPGARGSVIMEPGVQGSRMRLLVSGVPAPQKVDKRARVFVVWAVGEGARVINLGVIRTGASGNGALTFAPPFSLKRYSLILTAEPSASVSSVLGVPILATRAGELSGRLEPRTLPARSVETVSPRLIPGRYSSAHSTDRAFYREIDHAISRGPALTFTLEGRGGRLRARGLVRVRTQDHEYLIRAHFTGLPSPASIGANSYELWAVSQGSVNYLGSLPLLNLDNALVYVRASRTSYAKFNLLVTAEPKERATSPSSNHILSTTTVMREHHFRSRRWMRRRSHVGSRRITA